MNLSLMLRRGEREKAANNQWNWLTIGQAPLIGKADSFVPICGYEGIARIPHQS